MIASMAGLAALHMERANVRVATGRDLMARAQLAANSAVELALARLDSDSNWRTVYTHGVETGGLQLGPRSSLKFALLDPSDNNLSNDPNDAVTIRGIGLAGDATCVTTVTVEPGSRALNCLETSLHCGGRLSVDNGSTLDTNQWVTSNHSIYVQIVLNLLGLRVGGSWIDGNAWSTGSITSGGATGSEADYQSPPREMPDSTTVFDYYLSVGTRISFNSLSSGQVQGVLSATSNPYGPVNLQGIYVIDCAGQGVKVKDAQIRGTLVLLNTGDARTEGSIDWEPAAPNYPALMLRGPLRMDHSGTISGLVYVTGNISLTRSSSINGVVVAGGTVSSYVNMNLSYNSAAFNNPPPGFGAGTDMRVVPGTWRRTAAN